MLSETWYPGWWARVNGLLAPIYRVNAVLRGIVVPQGRSEVYLRYLPTGFKQGAVLSLGFGLIWLSIAIVEWRHRRRSRV